MQLQAHYDPAQDRVLLRRRGASSEDDIGLWLTRRQLMALAAACRRAGGSAIGSDADERTGRARVGAMKSGRGAPSEGRPAAESAKLVTGIRFRRVPGGLRIEFGAEGSAPLVLVLKGAHLSTFAELLVRVAARAKWDLDSALARVDATVDAPIRMLH